MKLYGLSGLGADERIFQFLDAGVEIIPVRWIKPYKSEAIDNYASRLAEQIDQNEKFGLIGVSFGGLAVIELAKITHPPVNSLFSGL